MWAWLDKWLTLLEEALQGDYMPPALPVVPLAPPLPINSPQPMPTQTKAEQLYSTAYASIGKDMSPANIAPNSLACAESLNGVFFAAFNEHLGTGAALTSTQALYQEMVQDTRLEQITSMEEGAIVISPTGYSSEGAKHGHCGVVGKFDVMSNDSNSGLWLDNYTKETWYNVFNKQLGFPVYLFRIK